MSSMPPRDNSTSGWTSASRLALLVVVAVTLLLRMDVANHFTHVDDIGVAVTLRDAKSFFTPRHIADKVAVGSSQHPGLARVLGVIDKTPLGGPANAIAAYTIATLQVPTIWTYAPLQFFATSALLNHASSYRQILFWGRLPSWLAGILTVWVIFLAARRLFPGQGGRAQAILAATVGATSAELVVYSGQMESYAIGACALSLMMLLLLTITNPGHGTLSWRQVVFVGVAAALLGHAQYQLLFATPALFAAWLFASWSAGRADVEWKRIVAAGLIFSLLVTPLYVVFLRPLAGAGIDWNAGSAREFVFERPFSFWKVVSFFPVNGYLAFEAIVAPVGDWHPLFRVCAALLAVLTVIGYASLATSRESNDRTMAVFIGTLALTWIVLILVHKITLGPTRHSLVLLPVWAVCVAAGAGVLARRFRFHADTVPLSVAGALVVVSFSGFSWAIESRRDPVNEKDIAELFVARRVSLVMAYDWSLNMGLMPAVLAHTRAFEQQNGTQPGNWVTQPPRSLDRIAFFSTRSALTDARFDTLRATFNTNPMTGAVGLAMPPRDQYQLTISRVIHSDVEVDVSRATKNGTNGLYLYVFERKPLQH